MGLFSKKGKQESEASSTDWCEIENIIAASSGLRSKPGEELDRWQSGMRLYDEDPVPRQRINTAHYLSPPLLLHLNGESPLSDDQLAETTRRILDMALRAPEVPGEIEFAPGVIRLALAILKQKGWQQASWGGSGRVDFDLDQPRIRESLSSREVSPAQTLERFFLS